LKTLLATILNSQIRTPGGREAPLSVTTNGYRSDGCEGRISHLRHRYDLHRARRVGLTGARIWCGYGVLAHNLTKITTLAAAEA
jgi:hypothetical protein